MADHLLQRSALLAQFEEHLAKASYRSRVIERYLTVANQFLQYLGKRHVLIDAVQPSHVTRYVSCELRRFVRRRGHRPASIDHWLAQITSGCNSSVAPMGQRTVAPDCFGP